MSWPPIRMRPASMSISRSSSRVSVVLPPPERPTRPIRGAAGHGQVEPAGTAARRPACAKCHRARTGRRPPAGRSGSGVARVEHRRRVQQQLGELRGLGHRALQPPVDLVELEHDPAGVEVVGERDHERLHPEPGRRPGRRRPAGRARWSAPTSGPPRCRCAGCRSPRTGCSAAPLVRTRPRCSAASRSSAANARTVSMFIRLSATCPETRAIAASRWSTSACRRRISGATSSR